MLEGLHLETMDMVPQSLSTNFCACGRSRGLWGTPTLIHLPLASDLLMPPEPHLGSIAFQGDDHRRLA